MLSVRTAKIDSLKPVYRCSLANSNTVYRLGFQNLKGWLMMVSQPFIIQKTTDKRFIRNG
ncbi:hypothetical protein CKQ84_20645 [Shewanella sp. WE21]|nr:hypothetical protein CKQ84_20645 [Shewanella sp. WE21]